MEIETSTSEGGGTSSSSSNNKINNETEVLLNVYDLTPLNNYVSWFGFGIFHSGVQVFRPGSSSRSSSLSGTSRARQVTVRRRPTTRLWGESYDGDSRDQDNESSDGGSGPRRLRERILRRPTPDEEP